MAATDEEKKKQENKSDMIDTSLEVVGEVLETVGDAIGGTAGAAVEVVGEILSGL